MSDYTNDTLLDGRVRYTQPRNGFRSGIEPILLAAAVPARTGERVLEGGSGAGATLLCIASRVPGVMGVGVERDPLLTTLAQQNAVANGQPTLSFVSNDIAKLEHLDAFDHACANPPYHSLAGTASPQAERNAAKRAHPDSFAVWAVALARALRPRGTLTFILPAATLPTCFDAFTAARCAPSVLLPLWPRAGQAAKLVLLQGVKGGKTPLRVSPGLVLHQSDGTFTPEAEAILRDGQALVN